MLFTSDDESQMMFKSDEEENDIEGQGNSSIHSAAIKAKKKLGAEVDQVLGSHTRDVEECEKPHSKKNEDQTQNNTTIISSKSYLKCFVSSEGDEENEESEYEDEESEEEAIDLNSQDNIEKIVPKNQPVLKFQLRSKMQAQIKQATLSNTFMRKFSKKIASEAKSSEDIPKTNKNSSLKEKKAVIKNNMKIVYISKDNQSKHS